MASDDFAAVRERIDFPSLVGELAQAKVAHRGPEDVRLTPCPFCGSETGFSVNPQTKTFYCHHAGCEAQGDVFTFVQRLKGFGGLHEALAFLADRVGHVLADAPAAADPDHAAVLDRAREIKRLALEYYAAQLWARAAEPYSYRKDGVERQTTVLGYQTEKRGHSEGVLKYMRVGWADGGLLDHLKGHYRDRPEPERKLAFAAMLASGLVKKTEAGEFRDLFRPGGYIYPVTCDGRIVTFTAKYPDDAIADYQVPKTSTIDGREISHWGTDFYFLNMDALDADDLVLVEGENDLLSVMDRGRHAVVAGMRGTPKREQIAALTERRLKKRTYLCFDTDTSGRETTRRLIEALVGPEYDVRVVAWPRQPDHPPPVLPDSETPAPVAPTPREGDPAL